VQFEFSRFQQQFSEDQLEVVWRISGVGYDPETGNAVPFPGGRAMVRFLRPIPGSWRDILRRAVRTMGRRRDLASLLALLRQIVSGYRPPVPSLPAPPARMVSQCHSRTDAPTRGSPRGTGVGEAPTMT
jgi:hypothetical protein